MPVTQRHAVHDAKKGLSACISYCKDPSKTEGGKYVSGVNCSAAFAVEEFLMIHEKYNAPLRDEERSCYHAWQSFDIKDTITADEVHQIGIELCKELYPEFQCLVCTHTDKGHLHNHIIINSRNLEGRKLEDRLGNVIEGLYGLRDASDQIALAHGCHVIQDAPKISRYKSRNYSYLSPAKRKPMLIEKIELLKESCNSFDEMLEHLSFAGYIIKKGKHIAVLPVGEDRAMRLKTLGKEYSEDALKSFFYDKRRASCQYHFEDKLVCTHESEIIKSCIDAAQGAKLAILKSETGLSKKNHYPKYFNSRYLELKRYHELVKNIEFLNEHSIYSYENLLEQINALRIDIEMLEYNYKKDKSKNNTLQARVGLAEQYLQNYNSYAIYKEHHEMFGNTVQSDEVKDFIHAKEELNNADLSEVRELLTNANKQKMLLNKSYANLSFLKHRFSELDKLRQKSLDDQPQYIKSLSFSRNMVIAEKSDTANYCIRLPYTQQYVYLPKESIIWLDYDKRGVMYLIDDKEYQIFDKNDTLLHTLKGDELEKLSLDEKTLILDRSK